MPTVINGIGTWYYGKRRIHRVKTLCTQCNSMGELESYDTTLFFVVVFIPVIPLAQKRIIDQCPYCRRHRVAPLKEWEAGKARAFNEVLEKLLANPDDKETFQAALALATMYQDETAFDKLADVLGSRLANDADVQTQLGGAYEYFSRWPEAEVAYSRAMAIAPTDDLSERLAVCMLKQDRPEEAIQYVSHVFEQKNPDKAWLSFWLIEGYMAKGLHRQALDLMDVRDQAFPSLTNEKAYVRQRRTAEKHQHTSKPIPSEYLKESAKTGYREGSGLGFKWPKYAAAALFLGLLGLYLASAWYRGQHRQVYLANGWTKPYKVSVNGEPHQLQPGAVKKIEVAEGNVAVDWPESGDGPQTVPIHTSFFGRPFNRPVFVINPDRCVLLEWRKTLFKSANDINAPPIPPPEYSTNKLLHKLEGVDYEFEPFPAQLQAESSRLWKTRVGLVPMLTIEERQYVLAETVPVVDQMGCAKRLAQLDADDVQALNWVAMRLPSQEAIPFVKTRLGDRPVRVEWHRAYQDMMELIDPTADLRPEYRKLAEETKRAPDALYLLSRLEDEPAGEKLCEEAAKANSPSATACTGLGYRKLARGDFEQALTWSKRAIELSPNGFLQRHAYQQSLLAAGKFRELTAEWAKDATSGNELPLEEQVAVLLGLHDKAGAEALLNRQMPNFGGGPAGNVNIAMTQYRAALDILMALAQRDRAKYLELSDRIGKKDEFTVNILKGNHASAAAFLPFFDAGVFSWEPEAARAALLYLAGLKANDASFAGTQWKKFVEALGKGDREARRLAEVTAGKQPLDPKWITNATFRPEIKRVILAALARKFPAYAKDLTPLAKKLDFEHDSTSLCLRYLTEER
jgi:tetratricopeptide (TPR) repeat protein